MHVNRTEIYLVYTVCHILCIYHECYGAVYLYYHRERRIQCGSLYIPSGSCIHEVASVVDKLLHILIVSVHVPEVQQLELFIW